MTNIYGEECKRCLDYVRGGGLFIWQNETHIYMQDRSWRDVLGLDGRHTECGAMSQTKVHHFGQGEPYNYSPKLTLQRSWITEISHRASRTHPTWTAPVSIVLSRRSVARPIKDIWGGRGGSFQRSVFGCDKSRKRLRACRRWRCGWTGSLKVDISLLKAE